MDENYMDSNEVIMYQTIRELSKLKIPMVFKGGLVTKNILLNNHQEEYIRTTKDIDANWIGKDVTMELLCEAINKALVNINPNLYANPFRNYDEQKSAGIEVLNERKETVFKFDIDIHRPVHGIARITLDNIEVDCVDSKQIIADKICSISSKTIFRRAKDLIDLYALSNCTGFDTNEILEIVKNTNHEIQDFDCFTNRKEDLKHAYDKLAGMKTKPNFECVYDRIQIIVDPFIKNEIKEWNPNEKNYLDLEKEEPVEERA